MWSDISSCLVWNKKILSFCHFYFYGGSTKGKMGNLEAANLAGVERGRRKKFLPRSGCVDSQAF
jgi:hypothetical protein